MQDQDDVIRSSFCIDTFELEAVRVADVDLGALHALSINVSWPHRAEDWQVLRELGQGLAAVDGGGRVHATGMWFPFGDDFATIGMMITAPRLQTGGGGLWLSRYMMAQAEGRALGLHATRASYRMFRDLGFQDEGRISQHQGIAAIPPERSAVAGTEVRRLEARDYADIVALDRRTTGTERGALYDTILPLSSGYVIERGGVILGFALMRRFGRGKVIGPVIAENDDAAIAVIHPFILEQAGTFLRVDTGQAGGPFARYLKLCGLKEYDYVTRMWLGRRWAYQAAGPATLYALAAQSTG